jgi:hypothetical protein
MLTEEHQAFHAHLDACEQCRLHPFDLCAAGEMRLRAAVAAIKRADFLASALDKHFGPVRAAAIRDAGEF